METERKPYVRGRKLLLKRPVGRPPSDKPKVVEPPKKRGRPKKDPEKKKRGRKPTKKYYVSSKTKKKPLYRSSRDYDFLQYIRVVMRWAMESSGLSRAHIELLLYLYPKGVFVKKDFMDYHKLFGMYQMATFNSMIESGWIYKWRNANPSIRQSSLYALTNKTKIMCSKMHQFLAGEKDLPMMTRTNPLLKSEKRIDGYYLGYLKQMNKERANRLKQEEDAE